MSTLTKIFIVLMVVFSIAFTMSTIGFVAKTTRWRDLANQYNEETRVVMTHMRNLAAAHAAEKTVWVDTKRSLDDRRASLEAELERLRADLETERNAIDKLQTEKSNALAHAEQLLGELKIAEAGRREESASRADIEKRNLDLEKRNADLNLRVQEQSAQILVLVQQQRQLEQQVNILREENTRLSGGEWTGGAVTAAPAGAPAAPPSTAPTAVAPIRGEIVEVSGKLATISVGSSDGVREGMVFVIYRGSEYIGDLEVTDVEPNLAAGKLVQMRATPRPTDLVADEPALGLAR